jgi:CheY-like chemotaxis protein
LRTPQTSISGYVKLISAQDAGEINPTQKEFLEIIDRNVDRLGLLINDILDTEKLESGRLVIRSERLDLVPLIREAMDTVQVLAKKKGLGLIYSGPDLGLFVLGDRERLLQVFLNLLTNAVKYTQKGQIEVRIEQADFAVFIRVQDTGIGLTEEEKSRIFEKFYRARAGLSASEGGTGLGLVISRGIILAHGGQIGVESQPGVGSTFSVSLPFSSRLPVLALETKAGDSNATVIEKTHTVWVLDRSLQRRKNWVNVFTQGQSTFSKTKVRCREFGHVEDVFEALAHVVDRPAVLVIAIDDGMIQARSTLSVLNRRMKGRIPVLLLGDGQNNSELIAIGVMGWLGLGASAVELRGALMDALAHRTANILLVEPDRDLRLLMRRGLEQAGLHVEDVSLGKEAVIKCNRDNYDLVLVSEELADLSSAETLVQLKKKGLRVVLVIPEEASAAHEKEILEKGFHAVATKAKGLQAFSQGILRLVNL